MINNNQFNSKFSQISKLQENTTGEYIETSLGNILRPINSEFGVVVPMGNNRYYGSIHGTFFGLSSYYTTNL